MHNVFMLTVVAPKQQQPRLDMESPISEKTSNVVVTYSSAGQSDKTFFDVNRTSV